MTNGRAGAHFREATKRLRFIVPPMSSSTASGAPANLVSIRLQNSARFSAINTAALSYTPSSACNQLAGKSIATIATKQTRSAVKKKPEHKLSIQRNHRSVLPHQCSLIFNSNSCPPEHFNGFIFVFSAFFLYFSLFHSHFINVLVFVCMFFSLFLLLFHTHIFIIIIIYLIFCFIQHCSPLFGLAVLFDVCWFLALLICLSVLLYTHFSRYIIRVPCA